MKSAYCVVHRVRYEYTEHVRYFDTKEQAWNFLLRYAVNTVDGFIEKPNYHWLYEDGYIGLISDNMEDWNDLLFVLPITIYEG